MSDEKSQLESEATHFKIVSRFATEMLSLNTEDDVLWHLTHNVATTLGIEVVSVYLFDEETQCLQKKVTPSKEEPNGKSKTIKPLNIKLGQGLIGKVAESMAPIIIHDAQTNEELDLYEHNILSILAIPLFDNDRLVGVIESTHHEVNYFTEIHAKTLSAIASIAATKIIQNRDLRKLHETVNKLEQSSKIQDALFEIAELIFETENMSEFYEQLHTKISSLTFAKNFYIALSTSDGKAFTIPYCVDEVDDVADNETTIMIDDPPSITGYVLHNNEPLLVYKQDISRLIEDKVIYVKGSLPEAWLGVPFGNESLRGIVVVQSYNGKFVFTEKDKLLLSFVAKHIRNAIERMQARSELTNLALHDPLTQLPNRILFNDRLKRALVDLDRRQQHIVALLFLDLDKFKFVNDKYGHFIGDQLLKICAERLNECVRESDTICRQGGDEFVVLLVNVRNEQNIHDIANKIARAISEPIIIEDKELNVSTSIGVTFCKAEGHAGQKNKSKKTTPEKMFLEADEAMYQAKENGRNQVCFYQAKEGGDNFSHFDLDSEFKVALAEEQLHLVFQPIIDIRSGKVIGGESLIRWQHPTYGVMPPASFLPELEKGNQIIALDEYVVWTSIQYLKTWHEKWPNQFRSLNVNVSGKGFNSESIMQILESTYHTFPEVLNYLTLELTERSIVSNVEETQVTMQKIREMGVQLALDDFGTGYSSLSYLHQFNFDVLKIDKSFISSNRAKSEENIVLEAIINLAKALGIKTTAEGIETLEQLDSMKKLGCHYGQGYYLSRPVEKDVFEGILLEGIASLDK
ncbi:EAL domain-containing protein [Glaciecola sp. MF2-115]|uniref:bifunctional diguanylate cyclase/phosphodiesterase n=1 Tax=Glaciecola sp. MF2-115 TaxID=3384827 RepID=UPI00399EF231